MMIDSQPLPATDDPIDQMFWASAREGQLVIQTCADCHGMRFPPRPMCPECQSEAVTWQSDPGDGVVWSFAAPRAPLLPAFEAMMPYVTIIGALHSNPAIRIAGMAIAEDGSGPVGALPDHIRIGQPVRICFRNVSADCALPFWQLIPSGRDRDA